MFVATSKQDVGHIAHCREMSKAMMEAAEVPEEKLADAAECAAQIMFHGFKLWQVVGGDLAGRFIGAIGVSSEIMGRIFR